MRLFYLNHDGVQQSIHLGGKPVTIGRSAEADVMLLDEQASRMHCDIRCWEGAYYIKDLTSKNGTFVNDERIELHALSAGDRIRVGRSVFIFSQDQINAGATNALRDMQERMDRGKGTSTILREIVDQTGDDPPREPAPSPASPAAPDTGQKGPSPREQAPSDLAKPAPPRRKVLATRKRITAKKKIQSKKPPLKVKIRRPKREE